MADTWQRSGVEYVVKDSTRAGTTGVVSNLDRLERSARGAQRVLGTLGVGVGLAALSYGLRGAVREAMSFETGLARVNTMLDDSSTRYLAGYERQIVSLAQTYGESTKSLTDGLYDILSASIAPAKAIGVLEKTVKAAKGGFTSAATATKATVGILNAYGMSAEEAGSVTDLLHQTVKRGVITFEDLAQNIGHVTSLAAVLGVDLEAVAAAVATMTRAGMSAELAITSLKNILNTFKDPTTEAQEAAAELGLSLDHTSIQGSGLIRVMDRLRGANARQLGALMPSIRGLVGFASQLKNATALGHDYQLMLQATGASQRAYDKVVDTTEARMSRLEERWKALKRQLGTPIAEAGITALERFAAAADAIRPSVDTRHDPWTQLKELPEARQASVQKAYEKHVLAQPVPYNTGGNWQNAPQDPAYLRGLIEQARRNEERHQAGLTTNRLAAEMASQQQANTEGAMAGPAHWDSGTPIDYAQAYKDVTKAAAEWGKEETKLAADLAKSKEAVASMDAELEFSIEIADRMAAGHAYAADQVDYERAVWAAYGHDIAGATEKIEAHRKGLETLEEKQKDLARGPLLEWSDVARAGLEDLSATLTDIALDFENAGQYAERFAEQLAALAIREMVMKPLVQGVAAAFSSSAEPKHRGGIVGTGPVEPVAFHGGGLASDEVLAKLLKREVVLTERDADRLRRMGILNARGKPSFHTGGTVGGPEAASVAPMGRGERPNVSIKIDNQTGAAVAEPDVGVEFDLDEYIVNVVLRDAGQGGRTRDLMRGGG